MKPSNDLLEVLNIIAFLECLVQENEGNLSCSYPNTTSNAIPNFFEP
jgi:hypothetical protein